MLALPLALLAQPNAEYMRLKLASDEFFAQSDEWVKQMNAKPGTVNVGAVKAWKPLPGLWRKVEGAWREWIG